MDYLRIAALAAIMATCAACVKSEYQKAEKSVNGFIEIVMPSNAKEDTVIIFAPLNCPRESAQRARALHEQLAKQDIPSVMSANYSLRFTDNSEEFKARLKRTAAERK